MAEKAEHNPVNDCRKSKYIQIISDRTFVLGTFERIKILGGLKRDQKFEKVGKNSKKNSEKNWEIQIEIQRNL